MNRKINELKKSLKLFDCANCLFLEEIKAESDKLDISYSNSKYMRNNVINDFELVNDLLDKDDSINAAIILRSIYENINYIIATSDNNQKINISISPSKIREVLVDKFSLYFTDYFEFEVFKGVYDFLCKYVHPCSYKELVSYLHNTKKYDNYLLVNIKYVMLVVELIYLDYINKKNEIDNTMNTNFMELCTLLNFINYCYFAYEIKNKKSYLNKYFYHDLGNEELFKKELEIEDIFKYFSNNKEEIETKIKELSDSLKEEIDKHGYKEKIEFYIKSIE